MAAVTLLALQLLVMFLLLAMSAPPQFVGFVMNMSEQMGASLVLSKSRCKKQKGSLRVDGDAEEYGVDDIQNEFSYTHGSGKEMRQWKIRGRGEDLDLSDSSRHDSLHPIPLLTDGQPIKFII